MCFELFQQQHSEGFTVVLETQELCWDPLHPQASHALSWGCPDDAVVVPQQNVPLHLLYGQSHLQKQPAFLSADMLSDSHLMSTPVFGKLLACAQTVCFQARIMCPHEYSTAICLYACIRHLNLSKMSMKSAHRDSGCQPKSTAATIPQVQLLLCSVCCACMNWL